MALTDLAIRKAKPRAKPYKMGDARGLFLLVQPSGGRLWRFKYRFAGKERKLSLGIYPDVTLSEARKRCDDARRLLAHGKNPSREKQRAKARALANEANTFEAVASEYCEHRKNDGVKPWSPQTARKAEFLLSQLRRGIGNLPVTEIEPADVLAAVRRVEAKGNYETARRTLQFAGSVLRFAVATARLQSDPTRDLRGALRTPAVTHRAAILDPAKFGGLLRAIDSYDGSAYVRHALRLAPLVFVRPGELRTARWEDINLAEAVWSIPPDITKMRKPHHVPLARQSLAILNTVKSLTDREEGLVFPSIRTSARPMSDNTLNAALRRLGYAKDEATAHGFRATASTFLNESGKWSADAIERALAHGDANQVRAAYHRGAHWRERVEMAQWWADYLDMLRSSTEPIAPSEA